MMRLEHIYAGMMAVIDPQLEQVVDETVQANWSPSSGTARPNPRSNSASKQDSAGWRRPGV
jgi:hypothetical protein